MFNKALHTFVLSTPIARATVNICKEPDINNNTNLYVAIPHKALGNLSKEEQKFVNQNFRSLCILITCQMHLLFTFLVT